MVSKFNVMTVEDAAEQLLTTSEAITAELEAGKLKGFRVGGEWRTTEEAIMLFIGQSVTLSPAIVDEAEDTNDTKGTDTVIQTLGSMSANWVPTGKFTHVWPGGPEEYDESYQSIYRVGHRDIPFTVAFTNRAAAGKDNRRRVVVFWGTLETTMYPVVEFAGANDYATSHVLASVIKHPGGKHVRPGEMLPSGYEQLKTGIYTDYVIGPSAARSVAVIAKDEDYNLMVQHAILRAHQKHWM